MTQPNTPPASAPKRRPGRPIAADRTLGTILATGATRKEVCAVLAITGAALDNSVRSGCPRRPDGRFDLPVVIAWRQQWAIDQSVVETGDSPNLERWRAARADREQLALGKDRGELVEAGLVEVRTVQQILAVRQALNDMVRKLASRLFNAPSPESIEVELQGEVDHILSSFAQGLQRVPERSGADPAGNSESTPPPKLSKPARRKGRPDPAPRSEAAPPPQE